MNQQKGPNSIGWTRVWNRPGATWNPTPGCFHGCEWTLEGERVECYAKTMADRMGMYPQGFESAYWYENRLSEPSREKEPHGIFINSMGDLMGHWNSEDSIQKILDVCTNNPHHIFFVLTKAFRRLLKFQFPPNVWVGASSPPDFMHGKPLNENQKISYMARALLTLGILRQRGTTTWMSFEPLSDDMAPMVSAYPNLDWAVIGAGSNGPRKVQPKDEHVEKLLNILDRENIPVYFKENLRWHPIRREFPENPNDVSGR